MTAYDPSFARREGGFWRWFGFGRQASDIEPEGADALSLNSPAAPDRRAFEACFEQEYREARANAQTLAVGFCDIDHFKLVNDTHGHDAGDRVIKLVAQSLARISNDHCHVARHGGEEFVVLFRNVALDDAMASLNRLRQEMAERRLVSRANDLPFGQVTFSGGIADVFAFPDRRAALRAALRFTAPSGRAAA